MKPFLAVVFVAAVCAAGCSKEDAPAAEASGWPVLRTYEGECLRRVKMPLGGIGTGTVSLNGRGAFVDWSLCNGPMFGHVPQTRDVSTGFWLRIEEPDGRVSARLLEGPADTSLYEGEMGGQFPNHGFPRFRTAVFKAAYPLAQVALADPSLPVEATLEAMNPLVPGDASASGIPAALLRWRIRNASDRPLRVSVLGFAVNAAGGAVAKEAVAKGALRGASIGSADLSADGPDVGRLALTVPAAADRTSVACRIADLGWRVRMDRFWKQFVETGRALDLADGDAREDCPAVAVCVTEELGAHETASVPFVLSWRFPNRIGWARSPKGVGNFYATQFATAEDAAAALWRDLPSLEEKTVAFVRGVLALNAPDVVKEAALFNLSTLRTETCFRTADGHFFGWEGVYDRVGSCHGSCTHVWGYEHALVDLWPDLARDMTEIQLDYAMGSRGSIANRVRLPLDPQANEHELAAADGQMQCLVKAYENWRKTDDAAWLKRCWPKIRKAMSFCWIAGGWDADCDGVMEGCQHNTMDVEYYGPNPQMEFLYLAALKATAAMADACGDAAFAEKCRGLCAAGSAWTEANLFNGEWYEHKVVPPKGPVAPGLSYGNASNLAEPDFQLAAGCLVDQLLGDYASRHVGLGPVADEANSAKALDTILAKCASDNVGPRYNCGRDYAFPEEPALKMAWYPEGRMPKKPFPYYGENMTGFEYVVAANLAQRGRLAEAEKVVRDIRDRYDGRKRNPFDEAECGHHYSRALAAWSVLRAFAAQACGCDGRDAFRESHP